MGLANCTAFWAQRLTLIELSQMDLLGLIRPTKTMILSSSSSRLISRKVVKRKLTLALNQSPCLTDICSETLRFMRSFQLKDHKQDTKCSPVPLFISMCMFFLCVFSNVADYLLDEFPQRDVDASSIKSFQVLLLKFGLLHHVLGFQVSLLKCGYSCIIYQDCRFFITEFRVFLHHLLRLHVLLLIFGCS